ncbi:Ig-like domain-containing protein, partial [Anaerostipes caccae]|uniref:Ig-like domain-containing protein n=1 Tax=Anaerostipes caccae TaxID=105841 RepID=UPI0026701DCB
IFSGTYGNINGENKEAFLILHNGNIQGKISGWGYINAAPEEWNNDAVFVGGGIESSGWLTILGGTQSFTVDGDIKAGSLETDGQEANLQITSGSQITVKDFDPQVSITVLPKQGMISEGIYVTADSFVGNTEISRVRLKNTKGYVLPVQKSGEKYIGTLKEAPQLDAPRKITWDEKGFGELTWEKVPGASRYLVTVFKGDEEILTDEESSTESLDCSKDLSRYGKGGYKAAVQAVSDTGEYSDSDISYSDLLSYHVKASSIILSPNAKELIVGETFQLKARALPFDADCGYQWTSSDISVAEVNSEGEITALSPGQTVVTAEANDGSKVSASCQITVKPKPAEKIVLSQTEKTLYAGESFTLGAEVQPQDATNKTVKWSSSDPKVAAVNSTGKVTALSQGQAEVTAEANDGSKVKASCQITVKVRLVEKVVLSEAVKEVYAGESFALGAEVQPQDATDKTVKWSSSDPKVAAVNRTGKVTALSQGRAVVTAKANDGSGIKASCNIIVSVRSYSIEYVLNGGRNHRDNPSEFSNTPVRLKAPARDGYLFAGWYADAGFRSKVESVTQKRECRLYAKWQKIALSAPKLTSMKNPLGPTMTVNYSKVPGAAGYEISVSPNTGFSKSSTKRWETAAGGKTLTGLKKNTVYYVRIRAYRWDSAGRKVYGTYSSKTKGYTVKYRLNKGKNNNANMISYYNIKVPLKNPSRKGYRFKGWYTSKKYKKRIKTIPKGKRANYTLYAKWKKK